MKASELNKKIKEIEEAYYSSEDIETAERLFNELILFLHENKEYKSIVKVFKSKVGNLLGKKCFEVAYALKNQGFNEEAETIYERILEDEEHNTAVLNNLALIKEEKGQINQACDLISKAFEIDNEDEIVSNNYKRIYEKYDSLQRKKQIFIASVMNIENENNFVRKKLKEFFTNAYEDSDFKDGEIPIPNWKFKVLMRTDETKAESLKKQWLEKGYILDTNKRAENYVRVYELNPYVFDKIKELDSIKIKEKWIKGIEELSIDNLKRLGFFKMRKKIGKINKKYRSIILRDYEELFINYLFKNSKTVIVLSGSLVEVLLIYYCEKKRINKISYSFNNRNVTKKIYEADLSDLLNYFEENKLLSKQYVHLGNVSRIYRNYIHPGKEIRENDILDFSKAELCYLSVIEVMK